jgi:hypothetical protein
MTLFSALAEDELLQLNLRLGNAYGQAESPAATGHMVTERWTGHDHPAAGQARAGAALVRDDLPGLPGEIKAVPDDALA